MFRGADLDRHLVHSANMTPEDRGAFVRWQGISIQHLGQTINLLITLATGLVAYGINLVVNEHGPSNPCARISFRFAIVLLLLSVLSGICATLFRVEDFRRTAQIARTRADHPEDANELRSLTDLLGKGTRLWFWVQACSFLTGAAALVLSIYLSYSDKL
jgi:hypothetical protein